MQHPKTKNFYFLKKTKRTAPKRVHFHRLYRRLLNGGEGTIHRAYLRRLYRRDGRRHHFRDANGDFEAEIKTVLPDGRLMLRDEKQKLRTYAFKEVQYLKDAPNLRFRNATPC